MTQKLFYHPAVIVHELHPDGVIRRQAFLPNTVRSVGENPLQMKAVAVAPSPFFAVLYILRTEDYTITVQEQEDMSFSTGVINMKAFTEGFMVRRCLFRKFFTHVQGLIQACRGLPR